MQALTHLPKAQRLRVADAGVVWDHRRAMFVDSTHAAAVNVLAMNNAVYAQAASRDAAGTGEEEDDAVIAESECNGTSPVGGSLAARFVALRNEYSELQAKHIAAHARIAELKTGLTEERKAMADERDALIERLAGADQRAVNAESAQVKAEAKLTDLEERMKVLCARNTALEREVSAARADADAQRSEAQMKEEECELMSAIIKQIADDDGALSPCEEERAGLG